MVSVQCMSQLHSDWVRKVSYVWHNHSFISCANTPLNSLIMKDIGKKKKSYVFRIRKVLVASLAFILLYLHHLAHTIRNAHYGINSYICLLYTSDAADE